MLLTTASSILQTNHSRWKRFSWRIMGEGGMGRMRNLLWNELKLRKGSLIGWTIVLGFFGTIYMILYPALPAEMRQINPQALALLNSIGMRSFATFEGWVLSTKFNVLPLIAGLCGLFIGISALASEEDQGTLELLAALPLSRLTLILTKGIALSIIIVIAMSMVGLFGMLVFTILQIDAAVSALDLFPVYLSHGFIAFFFMTLSLFLGAYLPTRNATSIVGMGYLLLSFFGENLAGMAPVLDNYRPFFAFYYFKRVVEMLTDDVAWGDIVILLGTGLVFLVLAALSFQRRNIMVKAWPWQRPKIK